MDFSNSISSLLDPKGLVRHLTQPGNAAQAASKAALAGGGIFGAVKVMDKVFSKNPKPNTAGLNNGSSSYVEMNGAGYDGTQQAVKSKSAAKNGIAAAIMDHKKSIGTLGCGATFAKNICDFRKLKAPNALDDKLAGML